MKNVLIVEDDPMVALINRKYIELINEVNTIGCATEEEEIIKTLRDGNVDIIILDVYLPKKNGLEILKSLREKMYFVDVIMLTAANSIKEVREAFAYGVVDYLVKPFEFNRFKEAINKCFIRENILSTNHELVQSEIDRIISGSIKRIDTPKGIHNKTLDEIIHLLDNSSEKIWTIRELSFKTGISKVTIKKYMDYLEQCKKVKMGYSHGNVGRPECKYIFMK